MQVREHLLPRLSVGRQAEVKGAKPWAIAVSSPATGFRGVSLANRTLARGLSGEHNSHLGIRLCDLRQRTDRAERSSKHVASSGEPALSAVILLSDQPVWFEVVCV